MPVLDATTLAKIADLRTMTFGWQQKPETYQVIKIAWQDNPVYYSAVPVDILSPTFPASPVEARLKADSNAYFLPVGGDSSMGDKEISLEFWDGGGSFYTAPNLGDAGSFADLVEANGEGIKSEVFFWFPQVDLFLSVWTGHLRNDDESDAVMWRGKIANGFRSPNLPMPGWAHYRECQAVYGKLLDTQEEIDASGCPHNAHNPVGQSLPIIGNNLHATCPRLSPNDCIARGVPPEYHLSDQTISVTVLNQQTQGGNLYSKSRGNETNLKKTKRVIMGKRRVRDCEVLSFVKHYNNNTPDRGFFEAIYELCVGSVRNVYSAYFVVGGTTQWANAQHYSFRPGYAGQSPLSADRLTPHGYSLTAIMRYNFGWVHPGLVDQSQCRGSAIVEGLNTIRIYSDEDTYTTGYSTSRVWQIATMLTNRIWGYGLDYARLNIDSWIDAANWNLGATFTSPEGTVYSYARGESNVELNERSTQQQVEDMCLAGRLSRPFLFGGQHHIQPIRALTGDELLACPTFTDEGGAERNILYEGEKSTLKRSKKSDLDLPNRIEATFDEAAGDYLEATAAPIEDVMQQLKAGRVLGDTSRRKVTKKYSFLGVTEKADAAQLMHWLLWFGEFGEGGTKNNLEISFNCFFLDALALHEFKVIKVTSSQLVRYGFEYFQIKSIKYNSNLSVNITAQAFNQAELEAFETVYVPPEVPGEPPGNPGDIPIPTEPPGNPSPSCNLQFGNISIAENVMSIPINPC